MSAEPSLRRRVLTAVIWSLVQNWGSRALSAILFLALATLVTPEAFGAAAIAILVAMTLAMVADLGLGDALVQRRDLAERDVNLPFYASTGLVALLAAAVALLAAPALGRAGMKDLAPYVAAGAGIAPLIVLGTFQEAMYRRRMDFRRLALRTLAGSLAGGAVGIGLAVAGFGAAALVAQFAVQTAVSTLWLWARPAWWPGTALDGTTFRPLIAFGGPIVGLRVVDLFALRSVDVVILAHFGPAALGLFTVASRIYTLLLQLLQVTITSVALSVLSRIAGDEARLRRSFIRSASLSACLGTPVFVMLAALAPEVSALAFGARWQGTAEIMRALLLVGGVHCIQFIIGSYLMATGRPQLLLRLVVIKAVLVLPVLSLVELPDVTATARAYAGLLLLETPFAFAFAIRVLSLRWRDLVRPVGGPIAAAGLAFAAVEALRSAVHLPAGPIPSAMVTAPAFLAVYGAALTCLAREALSHNVTYLVAGGRGARAPS